MVKKKAQLIPKNQKPSIKKTSHDVAPLKVLVSKIAVPVSEALKRFDTWNNTARPVRGTRITTGGYPVGYTANVSPAQEAAAFSAVTAPFAFMGNGVSVAGDAMALPDLVGDTSALIQNPSVNNAVHLGLDVFPGIWKGPVDETLHTLGILDDTNSTVNP